MDRDLWGGNVSRETERKLRAFGAQFQFQLPVCSPLTLVLRCQESIGGPSDAKIYPPLLTIF